MISDDDVKRLFWNGRSILAKHWNPNEPLQTQFYRGIGPHIWKNQHPGGCRRHMAIFNNFNIIPKYCFSCYKILIVPRTVVELFKLMVVFEKLELPDDNSRKCMVECREQVSGAYKGFIYCRSVEEGKEIIKLVQKAVTENISKNISITLKRGCSEFALTYPEYAKTSQDTAVMTYKEEWHETEELADKKLDINTPLPASDTYNQPGYTSRDARIMLAWLKYAATIGDLSYLKISDQPLHPIQDVKRASPFQPVENSEMNSTSKIGRNAPCICGSGKKYKRCCGS